MRSAIERDPAKDKGKIFKKKRKKSFILGTAAKDLEIAENTNPFGLISKKSGEIEHRDSREIHDIDG